MHCKQDKVVSIAQLWAAEQGLIKDDGQQTVEVCREERGIKSVQKRMGRAYDMTSLSVSFSCSCVSFSDNRGGWVGTAIL